MNKILICGIGVSVIILIIGVTYLPGIIDRTIYFEKIRQETVFVEGIIDDRDCWAIKDLLKRGGIDDMLLKMRAGVFSQHCKYLAEINDEGIDISNTFTRSYNYP